MKNGGDGVRIEGQPATTNGTLPNVSKDNQLVNNRAVENKGFGFHVINVISRGNNLSGNEAKKNRKGGFRLTNARLHTLTDNRTEKNIGDGFSVGRGRRDRQF